jgi:putative peptide zinc metalloprotease protein
LLLGAYGVASMAYRMLVLVTILFVLFETLEPLGLRVLAELMLALVVMGVVIVPVSRAAQFLRSPIQRRRVDWRRLTGSCLVIAAVLAIVAWLPLPFGVHAPFVVEAGDASQVHLRIEGRLVEAVAAGTPVRAGDVVARLERPDLERKLQSLVADVSYGKLRLDNLESLRQRDPAAAQLIPAVKEQLEGKRHELAQQRRDVERLTLRSPVAGVVIAPPSLPQPRRVDSQELTGWWGSPLDPQNQGCWLEADTLVCLVGDPKRHDAVAYIDQSQMEFVRPGQRVRMRLDAVPGRILTGTVRDLAAADTDRVPRVLAESGQLPTRTDFQGRLQPVDTLFQARIALDQPDEPLVVEACGRARIVATPQSLARRLVRYLAQTFGWPAS